MGENASGNDIGKGMVLYLSTTGLAHTQIIIIIGNIQFSETQSALPLKKHTNRMMRKTP